MPQKKLHSIVTGTVQDYALHALAVVRESARDVKAVVRMAVKTHVEMVVGKDAKDVVMQPVRVTA